MRIADFGLRISTRHQQPVIKLPDADCGLRISDSVANPQSAICNPQSNYWLNVKFTSMVVATSTGSLLRKVGW
jgi:hypothetical protein